MNNSNEPNNTPPDFEFEYNEPEPPEDFFSAAPAAPSSAAASADADLLPSLAARLGVDLPPADLATLQSIGMTLGLCKNDAMWVLFLLQMKAGAAFKAVPHEVEKVILQSKEAAELQSKMASADAALAAAKNTKKEIFRVLAGTRPSRKEQIFTGAGAGVVAVLAGIVGFWAGNISADQYIWTLKIANFLGL